jgi:hypothetical protein
LQSHQLDGTFDFSLPVRTTSSHKIPSSDDWQASSSETVPPALISRARTIASEHKQLTERLADGFNTKAAKKLGQYSSVVNALKDWDNARKVSLKPKSLHASN